MIDPNGKIADLLQREIVDVARAYARVGADLDQLVRELDVRRCFGDVKITDDLVRPIVSRLVTSGRIVRAGKRILPGVTPRAPDATPATPIEQRLGRTKLRGARLQVFDELVIDAVRADVRARRGEHLARREIFGLCRIVIGDQVTQVRLLHAVQRLVAAGRLARSGQRSGTRYGLPAPAAAASAAR